MKRCPQCNRVFRDVSLKFCREDGAKLESTSDTLSLDEAPTLQLSPPQVSSRQHGLSTSSSRLRGRKSRG